MVEASFVELLRQAMPTTRHAALDAVPGLESLLRERFEAGRAAWPRVAVEPAAWVAQLARHLPAKLDTALGAVHPDLYLAVGLSLGDAEALSTFLQVFVPKLKAIIARRKDVSSLQAEEVLATLEDRLLFSGPEGSRIGNYSGRGALEGFLRAAVVNQLLNRMRSKHTEGELSDELAASLIAPDQTPELAMLAKTSQQAFVTAFTSAFRSLPPRERALLRLHTFEKATIDDIGRLYQVHRVTAYRWLEEARTHLGEVTRERLRDAIGMSHDAIETFLQRLPSRLEVSLERMFQSVPPK